MDSTEDEILVNQTPSPQEHANSYLEKLLANTQQREETHHQPFMDLHFPESCISLGPETQKARLSMENNARLLNQDPSSLFSYHPTTPPQHTPTISHNSPPALKKNHHSSSHQPQHSPLQSTQQSPHLPQSPHPRDVTLHLAFQPGFPPNSPSPPGISLEKSQATPPQERHQSSLPTSSSSKTAVHIDPPTHTNTDHIKSINTTAITSSELIQNSNRESTTTTEHPIPTIDDGNHSLALPDPTPNLDVQTDQHSCSEARDPTTQCDQSSTAISDARRKRSRAQFEHPSEEDAVTRDSSHLSAVDGVSLSAPPALVDQVSSQASTRSARRQPPRERHVSVVVPRLRKAQPTRSKSALPASVRPANDDHQPDMVESSEMPVQRVLAYRAEWGAFAPGTVRGVTADKVVVQLDAQASVRMDVAQLRLCHIRPGDLVQYIGTDLAEGESQLTSVRHPKRVLRVESQAPEFMDTPINAQHDVLVVCEPSLPAAQESDPDHLARFLVEAVVVLSSSSSRRPLAGLKDRLLPHEILHEFRALMGLQTGVGKRARLLPPVSNPTTTTSLGLFHGFGFLLTGAPLVPVTAAAAGVEKRPQVPRRGTTIEQLVRAQGGTVIGAVSELYSLEGSDMDLLAAAPHLDPSPCRLVPSSTHAALNTILLLADHPLKTLKYLLAIAIGIPCVSSLWVSHSCAQGRLLDWQPYMIGPGPSPFLGPSGLPTVMNLQVWVALRARHDVRSVFASRDGLAMLAEKRVVYVCGCSTGKSSRGKREWTDTVRPILAAMGAASLGCLSLHALSSLLATRPNALRPVHLLVLDSLLQPRSLPAPLRPDSSSSSPDLHIVSFEWVKLSLIFGRLLPLPFS